jgi:repressor LexA
MMTKLTKRQAEILALIETQLAEKGSPPTRAEIARLMGFRSPNAAEDHLRALAKKKVIELIPGTSRGIRLLKFSDSIPLVTDIKRLSRFGLDHLPQDTHLEPAVFMQQATAGITMPDDSLMAEGICAGDILLVKFGYPPPSSRIFMIKQRGQFHFERSSVSILSEDRQTLTSGEPSIEGYVTGVIRTY